MKYVGNSNYYFLCFFLLIFLATHQVFSSGTNEKSEDLSGNVQSQLNGDVADKDTLLLEIDSETASSPANSTNIIESSSSNVPLKQFDNISSQKDNETEILLDFQATNDNTGYNQEQDTILTSLNNPIFDTTSKNTSESTVLSPQSNEIEEQLLRQASQELDIAAQELEAKLDLITSPSPSPSSNRQEIPSFDIEQQSRMSIQPVVEEEQSVTSPKLDSTSQKTSPAKKATSGTTRSASSAKAKPTTATAPKSTEHKPASGVATASKSMEYKAAVATTKSIESKPSTAVRKTFHSESKASAATSNKSKVTPTSPNQKSSITAQKTVNIIINLRISITKCMFF